MKLPSPVKPKPAELPSLFKKGKKPISAEAQRARDMLFADLPESTIEERAFELYANRFYSIDAELDEFENVIVGCENKFFDN